MALSDVEVDELGAVVVTGTKGDREAYLPQGAGGADADSRERLGGVEPAVWYVKQAESFHGEHVEASSTVDEGLGHCYVADGGCAEHWECARASSGNRVVPRVKGEVGLGRRPSWRGSLLHRGGADLAEELLGVAVRGWRLRAAEEGHAATGTGAAKVRRKGRVAPAKKLQKISAD